MDELREAEIIDTALVRFRELTGLDITQQAANYHPGLRPDGWIQIVQGDRQWPYVVECKANVDRVAILHQVKDQLGRWPGNGLLIAPYLAPEVARNCQEIGLPFLDVAGNAFLKEEGLFVLVTGQKPDKAWIRREKPRRAFDRTGLRVLFALLAEPELLQATYRDIAKAAGVALGTVGWVLTDLREQQFLVEDRQGQRRWLDQTRVIQTWVNNFPLRLRERLNPRRFRAANEDWWKEANPENFGGYWGGEIAAAKLMGELVPKTATVKLAKIQHPFLVAHRLRADPQGPIEVLDAFWDLPPGNRTPIGIAPPLLVFADLQWIGDPRTLEQARMIHDRYLA